MHTVAIVGSRGMGRTYRLSHAAATMHGPDLKDARIVTPYRHGRNAIVSTLSPEAAAHIITSSDLARVRDRLRGFTPLHLYVDDVDQLLDSWFFPHRVVAMSVFGQCVDLHRPEFARPK